MKTKGLVTLLSGTKEIIARGVRIDQQQCEVIIEARVPKRKSCRCPFCGKRGAQYDQGRGVRRWRCLDMGNAKVFIEATAPRIRCPKHGIVVAAVPWARHGSAFSQAFESTCCWLSIHSSKKVVSEYLRIDWHTVGAICTRVYQELEASRGTSRFDNLERIGIDETSYKKGHKYLTVVVNHETNSVVWVGKGYGKEVLSSFFKLLDDKQRGSIKLVSADGARWIASCVEAYCPNATRCIDPFHVVSWATGLLDDIRKELWREVHKKAKETTEI
jgi:transposase